MLTCTIQSLGNYLPVELKDGKPTNIGRSVETKIKSSQVSRNQIEIIPNYEAKIVTVKQTGPNDSAINGVIIGHGLYAVAKDSDIIQILAETDEFNYRVCYEEKAEPEDKKTKSDNQAVNPKPVKIPKMFMSKSARMAEFKKENLLPKGNWETLEAGKALVYISADTVREPKKTICAFDMDGTIIGTKSGRVFPVDDNDWKFLNDSVVAKLQKIGENPDAKLVMITNQAGLANGKTQEGTFKKKIETIVRQIGVPMLVFVLPGKNEYRKPLPTVWTKLINSFNGSVAPDLETSFYCGDAAGRKKDHSKVDRLFALNIGIKFYTPEEFFLGQKPQPHTMPVFDSKKFIEAQASVNNSHITFSPKQEMIIMVGYPGSGKSQFVKSMLVPKSYTHINRDTLKTAAKCKATAESALEAGMSVVVDNTNPTPKEREEYIKLARKHGVPCRCFVLKVDHAQALHNNKFRELSNADHAKIPEVAFNTFKSKFQEPSESEGFVEIQDVHFVPNFANESLKALYSLYLLEK